MKLDHRIIAAALLLSACGHQHLWDARGRSYHSEFALQRAPHPAGAKHAEAVRGLDSQEAAIIAASYRRSLVPKDTKVQEQPVLLIAPQPGGQGSMALPLPSVPKE
jgi:hypothetical protein